MNAIVPIIDGKLYWSSCLNPPPGYFPFSIDKSLAYEEVMNDFGPLDLGMIHSFCTQLVSLMETQTEPILHYCSNYSFKRANAALLICAFQVSPTQIFILHREPEQVWKLFERLPIFRPFRDAGVGHHHTYDCRLEHCIAGLYRASQLGWYNYQTFDIAQYQTMRDVRQGNMTWIVPGKLLAFSSPGHKFKDEDGFYNVTPELCCILFKRMGISGVVRLCRPMYESQRFLRNGIRHYDLMEGQQRSELSLASISEFSDLVDSEQAIAVHCKGGYGLTPTLIGCYVLKAKLMNASEYIAWARICRPGSVLGTQQHFLHQVESYRWKKRFYPKVKISAFTPLKAFIVTAKAYHWSYSNRKQSRSPTTGLEGAMTETMSRPQSRSYLSSRSDLRSIASGLVAPSRTRARSRFSSTQLLRPKSAL
jgi:cell division cycle 14